MTEILQFGEILVRLATALLAGAAIGVERQWNQKRAGLRTNALVSLGAAGFVAFSSVAGQGDPTRIAAQVVSGIGFLGAGIIFREGIDVRGLNTAATLWCSAMVGTFAGGGFYAISLGAAGIVVLTNIAMRPAILHIRRTQQQVAPDTEAETQYSIAVTCRSAEEAHVRSLLLHALSQGGLGLRRIESTDLTETGKVRVMAETCAVARKDGTLESIVGRMSLEPFVSAVSWEAERLNGDV